jgi:hypothetical protein
MVPAMKFRVTGIARDGQKKSIPHDSQSLALRDAKQKKAQGWEDVMVEQWQNGTFQPETKSEQALAKVPQMKSNENEEIAFANLIAHTKTAYLFAKKGKFDQEMLITFARVCIKTLYECGMQEDELESIVTQKEEVGVHA